MPLIDYHVHPNTFHNGRYISNNKILDKYISVCREKNIVELGFAEHGPRFHFSYNHRALSLEEIPFYISNLAEFRNNISDIRIKIGVEVDYTVESEYIWRDLFEQYDFDFMACSIHYLDDWLPTPEGIKQYIQSGKTIYELYKKYYRTMQQAAKSQIFSYITHPDFIKIHSLLNQLPEPNNRIRLFEETCAILKEYNQVIELNTGWKKTSLNCYRPDEDLLVIAQRYDIPITLGSDAHRPEDIGLHFDEAIKLLKQTNYSNLISFEEKKAVILPL